VIIPEVPPYSSKTTTFSFFFLVNIFRIFNKYCFWKKFYGITTDLIFFGFLNRSKECTYPWYHQVNFINYNFRIPVRTNKSFSSSTGSNKSIAISVLGVIISLAFTPENSNFETFLGIYLFIILYRTHLFCDIVS
jgi:hypothetical protein